VADYPKTGSVLDERIRTGLSTQIVIMVNNEPVGAVQSFQETQNRQLKAITEVGTDGIIELVPSQAARTSLTLRRVAFDGLSITEAFARGFRNIQAQRLPFDIVVIDQFTGTEDDAVYTTYHNCFFERIGKTYGSDDYVILEDATVQVEYISSTRAGEAVTLSQGIAGGRINAGKQEDDIELLADSGIRRGSLDFPGLISVSW
jgi:hypothetical protein